MEKYEVWKKDQLSTRKLYLVLAVAFLLLGIVRIAINDGDVTFFRILWILIGLFFVYATTLFKGSKEEYERLKREEEEEKAEVKRQKDEAKKEKEKEDKPRRDALKKKLKSLDSINEKLTILKDLECWNPTESKRLLSENEELFSQKLGDADLHKILKVVNFISDYSKEIDSIKESMINDFDIDYYKRILENEFKRDHKSLEVLIEKQEVQKEAISGKYNSVKGGVYGCTKNEALVKSAIGIGEMISPMFESEVKKVQYLEGLCISMMVFGSEGKKLRYFEILESFDKLGALDSSWQKNISNKLNSIDSKLDLLANGLVNLSGKMDELIKNGDVIISELESLNSKMSSSLTIQSLNLYQNYKINKNTKGLKS